ncbi:MAG: formylglycine-generating enzyme family protein [Chloroflexi bacterium]|nr:formylglycine-generating enzyme family protein [Chloroflexota bacterium]
MQDKTAAQERRRNLIIAGVAVLAIGLFAGLTALLFASAESSGRSQSRPGVTLLPGVGGPSVQSGNTNAGGFANPTSIIQAPSAPITAAQTAAELNPAVTRVPGQADLVLTLTDGVALDFVRVPAGKFLMGSPVTDSLAEPYEKPQFSLTLAEYYVGMTEITNAEYAAFVHTTGYTPTAWQSGNAVDHADYPATPISWIDAVAFCEWASRVSGRTVRLPSEAQWEKAARGTDGRAYPWGEGVPTISRLNYDMLIKTTTPAGSFSPAGDSPYGAADMAGNVWEWTSSLWSDPRGRPYLYPYNPDDGRETPYPDSAGYRILRGGSFLDSGSYSRSAYRGADDPGNAQYGYGFRVVVIP